jgi:hypothetical protein
MDINTEFRGEVTLEALRQRLRNFAKERDWDQFHTPRNLILGLDLFFLVFISLTRES